MSAIDGYTFQVNLSDRGVTTTLRTIQAEAKAMKTAMKANFDALAQGGQTLAAYNYKVQQSERIIGTYSAAIQKLKQKNDELNQTRDKNGQLSEADARAYANNARKIESYNAQLNKLRSEMANAQRASATYVAGIKEAREATDSLNRVSRSYAEITKVNGNSYRSQVGNIKLLQAQKKELINQSNLEIQSGNSLVNYIHKQQIEYNQTVVRLQHLNTARKQAKGALSDEVAANGSASSKAKDLRNSYNRLSSEIASLSTKQGQLTNDIRKSTKVLGDQASKANTTKARLAEVTTELKRVNPGGFTRVNATLNTVNRRLAESTKNVRAWASNAKAGIISVTAAGVGLTAAVSGSVKMAANLQQRYTEINNLAVTGGEKQTEVTKKVAEMQNQARDISLKYGESQQTIADGYETLVKRGYTTKQAIGSMTPIIQAARASGDSFDDTIKVTTSTLESFGMKSDDVSEQMKNTAKVANELAMAADATSTSFKDIGDAMTYAGSTASASGITLHETAAALGVLSNNGLESTQAGTGLQRIVSRLAAPTSTGIETLNKYNLAIDEFKDKSGKLIPLQDIFKKLNDAIPKSERLEAFNKIFGQTGQNSAIILSDNLKALEEVDNKVKKAYKDNYVEKLAKKNMQTTKMQLDILKRQFEALGINIGSVLLPQVNKVADAISKWASSSSGKSQVGQLTKDIKGIGSVIADNAGSILEFLGGFASGLMAVGDVVGTGVKWMASAVSFISKVTGLGKAKDAPKIIGGIAGALVGITAVFKIGHGLLSGVRSVAKDIHGVFKKDKTPLTENNRLLQKFIDLQQTSLGLSEQQAQKSGIYSSDQIGKENATLPASTTSKSTKSDSKKANPVAGIEQAATQRTMVVQPTQHEKATTSTIEESVAKGTSKAKIAESGVKAGGKWRRGFKKGLSWITLLDPTGLSAIGLDIFGGLGSKMAGAFKKGFGKIGLTKLFTTPGSSGLKSFMKSTGAKAAGWLGIGLNVAMAGVDIFKAITKKKDRAKNVGKGIGALIGTGIGAYFGGPAGAAIGGQIGRLIGGYAGSHFGKAFSKFKLSAKDLLKGDWSGAAKASLEGFNEVFKLYNPLLAAFELSVKPGASKFKQGFIQAMQGDWSGAFKSWQKGAQKSVDSWVKTAKDTWQKASNFFSGKGWKTNSQAKSSSKDDDDDSKTKTTKKTVKSLGGNHYSKTDIANVKSMNSAIKAYTGSLKKLKDAIKKDDPTKQLNGMNNRLSKSIDKWKKLSSPIKDIAKAFDTFKTSIKDVEKSTKNLTGKNGVNVLNSGLKSLQNNMKNTKLGYYFKKLAKDIKKSKINIELGALDKAVNDSVKGWKKLSSPMRSVSRSFNVTQKAVKSLTTGKNSFASLRSAIKKLERDSRKSKWGQLLASQAKIAFSAIASTDSKGLTKAFKGLMSVMTSQLRDFGRAFTKNWKNNWNKLDKPITNGMKKVRSTIKGELSDLGKIATNFEGDFLDDWRDWVSDIDQSFKDGFNKLPKYAESSMNKIIDKLNNGIKGINSVISDFGGDKKLTTIRYANGTQGGHPGGHMIVNDSVRPSWKELVKFPGQPWTMFNSRNVLIPNAPAGTQVLSGEQTKQVMNEAGIYHYADGSLSEKEQDIISQAFISNPKKAAKGLMLKYTNWDSNINVVAKLGKASAIAFSQGIANVLKDLLGIIKEPINGDWTPVIKSAFHYLHKTAEAYKVQKLLRQIKTESNGNEKITQHISDVNSRNGNPAKGLLQFIPQTFSTWAVSGHTNIWSGFDQILAAINALDHGGEGGWSNVGNGHGWANGGRVQYHGMYEVAEGNLPEYIIPMDMNKRPRAYQLLGEMTAQMAQEDGWKFKEFSRTSSDKNPQTAGLVNRLDQILNVLASIAGLAGEQIQAIKDQGVFDSDAFNRKQARNIRMKQFGL